MLRLHFLCAHLWFHLFPLLPLLLVVPFQADVAWVQGSSQQWGPCWCSSVVQVPGSVFKEFPPSWVNQGCKEQMGTTYMCIFVRCCHSASSIRTVLPNSASRCCLVPLCSEESLVPTEEPALLCVALVPASEITSPVFLVSDWRQNRDN